MKDQLGRPIVKITYCANCGDRVYRTAQGKWRHCYYPRETRCKNGKRVMGKKE